MDVFDHQARFPNTGFSNDCYLNGNTTSKWDPLDDGKMMSLEGRKMIWREMAKVSLQDEMREW